MTLQTIRADGVEWPLPTFLDAYGYRLADRGELPRMDGQVRLAIVSTAGELRSPMYADQVGWHDVLAYRPLDGAAESLPCDRCGEPTFRTSCKDLCEDCEDAGEYGH